MSKSKIILTVAIVSLGLTSLSGQTFPLSENFWSNPGFRDRVMGSYGFNTELEPKLSDEDAEFFKILMPTMDASMEQGGALLQKQLNADSSAIMYYMLATVRLQLNDLPSAIKAYETAIQKFPSFMRAYKNLGIAYVQSNELDKGVTMLIKGLELGGGDSLSYGLLGYSFLNLEQYSSAANAYGLAVAFDPHSKDWKLGKVRSLIELGAYEEASGLIAELIELDPRNHELYLHQANVALAREEVESAMANLEIVRRMTRGDEAGLFLLADIYANQGMYELANTVYGEALELAVSKTKRFSNIHRAVRTYMDNEAWDAARSLISLATKSMGTAIEKEQRLGLLNLGAEVELASNNSEAAAATLNAIVEEDPMNGRALILLARFASGKGDFEEAEFLFKRAENIEDVAAKALLQHGQMLVNRREYAEAANLIRQSLDLEYQANVADYLRSVEEAAQLR